MKSWIHPRKYLLKMLDCKTLDFKGVLGVGVPTIFYQPSTWEQIRKVNFWQCRTLNSFCFRELRPLYPAGAAPRPLACLGAFSPHSRLLSKYHRLLQILLTALFVEYLHLIACCFPHLCTVAHHCHSKKKPHGKKKNLTAKRKRLTAKRITSR